MTDIQVTLITEQNLGDHGEMLRRAARLMRERAEAATPGPWHAGESHWRDMTDEGMSEVVIFDHRVNPAGLIGAYPGSVLAFTYGPGYEGNDLANEDAAHIASWHPAVALAVADLLDRAADDHDETPCPAIDAAIAVARTYLAEPPSTQRDPNHTSEEEA